ncbi:MAG: hypothetical protein KF712_13935 [Akkermansiaceae bacterium]|nr:hypothetical protein [Akkermansiaceae bacterium]
MSSFILRFNPTGKVACLYTEAIDLRLLGTLEIKRLTDIRFHDEIQQWEVVMAGTGEIVHRDPSREACLAWERETLG